METIYEQLEKCIGKVSTVKLKWSPPSKGIMFVFKGIITFIDDEKVLDDDEVFSVVVTMNSDEGERLFLVNEINSMSIHYGNEIETALFKIEYDIA